MVSWDASKNAYICSAALGALNTTITNEIAAAIIANWPADLGETPSVRALKDQIKKVSSSSFGTTTKKSDAGVKKPKAAAKGKGKGKGRKRMLNDEESDGADAGDEQGNGDEGDAQPANKKQKKVVVKKEVEDEEV